MAMSDAEQQKVPPPSFPVTAKINLAVLDFVFQWFMRKYLPAFKARITSSYRSPAENAATPGAAGNSAHLHGLAYDFTLQYENGSPVPEIQAKKLYEGFIAPNWPGFTEWEATSAGEGYHVHVNLSREITTFTGVAGAAALGVLALKLFSQLGGSK